MAFVVGQEVMCTVLATTPWGVIVEIDGAPNQGASIDLFREGYRPESTNDVPAVGTRVRAIIARESRGYLHLRPGWPPRSV